MEVGDELLERDVPGAGGVRLVERHGHLIAHPLARLDLFAGHLAKLGENAPDLALFEFSRINCDAGFVH